MSPLSCDFLSKKKTLAYKNRQQTKGTHNKNLNDNLMLFKLKRKK